jgi:DNA-binding HxlR family transcriptional regulator
MKSEELLLQEGANLNQVRYKLTRKGEGLLVVIRAMNEWGERWLARSNLERSKITPLETS